MKISVTPDELRPGDGVYGLATFTHPNDTIQYHVVSGPYKEGSDLHAKVRYRDGGIGVRTWAGPPRMLTILSIEREESDGS